MLVKFSYNEAIEFFDENLLNTECDDCAYKNMSRDLIVVHK